MSTRKPIAIDDYVRQWGNKVIRNTFSADDEENLKKGGDNLYFLLKKIVIDDGTKADLEIPLRVVRDLILEIWKQEANTNRYRHVYMMFNMYDRVFYKLLGSISEGLQAKEDSRVRQEIQMMDELRSRLHKCVTGETWKDYPALRMVALRQVFNYHKESYNTQTLLQKIGSGNNSLQESDSGNKSWFGRKRKDESGEASAGFSWEDTLDACVSASSEKLFPLLKMLLANGQAGVITMEGIVGVNLVVAEPVGGDAAEGVQPRQDNGTPEVEAASGSAKATSSLIDLDFMGSRELQPTEGALEQKQQANEDAIDGTDDADVDTPPPPQTQPEAATSTSTAQAQQTQDQAEADPFADLTWEKFE
eukprot:TRINITY_DN1455_c0_g1_i1.p1 TRINITY_DN1455_c0_g1~~TRINITY_DN1455_c0_g1_i1.p1  ORF type:complete len:382 (-),score=65.76 TRINITY_DN1455_c0_g1_i1:967-2052(-)